MLKYTENINWDVTCTSNDKTLIHACCYDCNSKKSRNEMQN